MIYITQSVHRNCQKFPNQLATVFKDRKHTWTQFRNRVARFAGGLQKIGVQENDRVGILALNSDRYLEFYMGVPWAGAACVPLNTRWSVKENAYTINDCETTVLLVDDEYLHMVPGLKKEGVSVKEYIYIGEKDCPEGMYDYEKMIAENEPVEDACRNTLDLAGVYYTGGTTGFPKGAMITHMGLWSSAMAMISESGIGAGDVYLHAAPMFHLADGAFSNAAMVMGATHTFLPTFTPQGTIDLIAKHKVSHLLLVPVMIQMVTEVLEKQPADMSSLRFMLYGASPITEPVLLAAIKALPHVKFTQGYGQTELSPLVTVLNHKYHVTEGPYAGRLKSAGQAVACVEIKIVDEDDQVLSTSGIGQVIVRGPNAMLQYWNNPKETAISLRNGWIYTGDVGYMDEEGFLFLVDRAKDMIVSGGENVYSTETENAVMKHPAVRQAIVIGIPHKRWGEQVHAEVILKDGMTATEQEIIGHCREYIASYKCPKSVKFRTEPFPVSGAGKLLKREVKKAYWGDAARAIN